MIGASQQAPAPRFVPEDELRDAGAIVLAKANLTELARGGTTVSSLGGQTRNPYDLTRTPGGLRPRAQLLDAMKDIIVGTSAYVGRFRQ